MGQRIGALWRKADGKITGQIETASGICIPANAHGIGIAIIANEQKIGDERRPDYFVELREMKERGGS